MPEGRGIRPVAKAHWQSPWLFLGSFCYRGVVDYLTVPHQVEGERGGLGHGHQLAAPVELDEAVLHPLEDRAAEEGSAGAVALLHLLTGLRAHRLCLPGGEDLTEVLLTRGVEDAVNRHACAPKTEPVSGGRLATAGRSGPAFSTRVETTKRRTRLRSHSSKPDMVNINASLKSKQELPQDGIAASAKGPGCSLRLRCGGFCYASVQVDQATPDGEARQV
jgi:hypothetical protein